MANFNRVILVGRLTRDVEVRTFSNGGKVAKFGFAVSNRKKNTQSGQWEDVPMFIDCEAFNRGENGTLANTIETYCRKGSQIMIEGALHLDQWDDKTTGQKKSKHKVVVDQMQLLDPKQDGQGGGGYQGGQGQGRPAAAAPGASRPAPPSRQQQQDDDGGYDEPPAQRDGEEIPF